MKKKSDSRRVPQLAAEVWFIFALTAVMGYYAVWRVFSPPPQPRAAFQTVDHAELQQQIERPAFYDSPLAQEVLNFYKDLEPVSPEYTSRPVDCPVDNTRLELPIVKHNEQGQRRDNSIGGIASDFMKIAVGVPVGTSAQPDLLKQQWEQMPVTCPTCLNTYMETDIRNLSWEERLRALRENWELERVSPGLAAIEYTEWTPDLQNYSHYLSSREALNEHLELGWIALSGAYAANFSTWSGEHDVYIPSAAFYALAASEFQTSIDMGWEGLPEKSRSETILALLVCQRLLGRQQQAEETERMAREILQLEPALLPALDNEAAYLADQHYALERVNLGNRPAPIIGWQLDKMLPGMNGHITEYRGTWQELYGTEQILREIEDWLVKRTAQLNPAGA